MFYYLIFLKSISRLNLWPVEPVNADLIWSGISPKKIKHWCVAVWMNPLHLQTNLTQKPVLKTVTELKWNLSEPVPVKQSLEPAALF